MTEPTEHEIPEHASQPATKDDVNILRTEVEGIDERLISVDERLVSVESDVKELKGDVKDLKKGQKSLEAGQEAILKVVKSIDAHLQEHKDLPAKVERLEKRVFHSH